jgi:hypothetical protein
MADASSSTMAHTVHMQLKLEGKMFHTWREMTLNTLELQELDGAVCRPLAALNAADEAEENVKVQHAHIIKKARRGYTIIMTSMSDELKALFITIPRGDAYRLWEAVTRKYESKIQANKLHITQHLLETKMKSGDAFDAYQSRILLLANQLRSMDDEYNEAALSTIPLKGLPKEYGSLIQSVNVYVQGNIDLNTLCTLIQNEYERLKRETEKEEDEQAIANMADERAQALHSGDRYRSRGV